MTDYHERSGEMKDSEKVSIEDFFLLMENNINAFKENMKNVHLKEMKSDEAWMETFLRWCEWKTDMHDAYWGEDES